MGSALLFAWLAYLVTKGQPNFELSVFSATLRLHLLFAALALVYVANLALHRRLPRASRLDWPIAALALVYVAATLDSAYPRISLESTLLIGAVVLTYFVFHDVDILTPEVAMRGLAATGVFAACVVLYHLGDDFLRWRQLAAAVGLDDVMPPAIPRVKGVGDNANAIAMALNLTLPFAVAVGMQRRRPIESYLALLAGGVIFVAILLTLSRGAWLGALASVAVFTVLSSARRRDLAQLSGRITVHPVPVAIASATLLVIVLAGGLLLVSRWDSRPTWLFRSSLSPRYDAVEVGVDIFRDRPFLGAGPYTYPLLYNSYSGKYPVENIHPHNGYLAALDATGIAGGLVLLAGGVVLALAIAGAYRRGDAALRLKLAACVAALTSLAVHALVDTPNVWLTVLLPLAVVLALTMRLAPPPLPGRRLASVPRLLPLALVPCLFVAWSLLDLRHAQYHDALRDLSAGRHAEAAATAQEAADADPAHPAAQIHAGVAQAIRFLVERDRVLLAPGQLPLRDAEASLRRAVEKEPRSGIAYANLALVLRLQAEFARSESIEDEAVEAARDAIRRSPTDGTVAAAAGSVFEWADRIDEARFAYGLAVEGDPSLAQSPYWATNPARTRMRPGALEGSSVSRCRWGRVSAIYGGYRDDLDYLALGCRSEVEKSPGDARARSDLAVILHVLGKRDEARREANEAVRRVPDDPFARTALGIVKGGDGDLAGARQEFARGAYIRDPGDPDAALLLSYTYQPPADSTNPVIANLRLPAEKAPLPDSVLHQLQAAYEIAAPFVYDNGRQDHLLGILYYRARLLRESPVSILVPMDWLQFASPRALLIEEALDRAGER